MEKWIYMPFCWVKPKKSAYVLDVSCTTNIMFFKILLLDLLDFFGLNFG